jgi:hypothetical protein
MTTRILTMHKLSRHTGASGQATALNLFKQNTVRPFCLCSIAVLQHGLSAHVSSCKCPPMKHTCADKTQLVKVGVEFRAATTNLTHGNTMLREEVQDVRH